MAVIDAHHHVGWHDKRPHQWPTGSNAGATLDRDFTPDDLAQELQRSGVDGTILIQSVNETEETNEFLDLADRYDFLRGVVGWAPLDDPAIADKTLEALAARRKLVGVRHLLRVERTEGWLAQPGVLASLKLVARRNLVFELVPVNADQFEQAFALARNLPDLQVVLDHLGRPPVPERGWEPWATLITRAAEHPNIAMKLSAGMALVSQWRWSTEALRRYVDHVLAAFGPERVLAASNWPVSLLAGSYEEIWRGITDLVATLSPDERAAVLGGNAQRLYRLP
jgi:L-fuconolactonase